MKKCGIFAIAALMTVLCGRLNAQVQSDIVGYTTITLESGKWYQIGAPFMPLDKETTEYTLNSVFSGFGDGDKVLIYDPVVGYKTAYWRSTANDGVGGWCTTPKGPTIATTLKLSSKGAAFISKVSAGSTDVTFSGKVSHEEIPFGDEDGDIWSMVTPVWPEEIRLSDLDFSNANTAEGDKLFVYDPVAGYKTGYWRPTANGGVGGWCTTPKGPTIAFDRTLGVGQALFINKISAGIGTLSVK